MRNRREFLRLAALGAMWPGALAWGQAKKAAKKPEGILVNDLHGQLSATLVNRIVGRREAIVFKVYDSAKDGRARFTPHTSFQDPTTPPGAPPRQSIEARTLAFSKTA